MQVNQPGPRGQIDRLLSSLTESGGKEGEAVAKVTQIGIILGNDPSLKEDRALIDRVFTAIDALTDEAIQEKCRMLILGEAPETLAPSVVPEKELPTEPPTLTIDAHELGQKYGEGLWDKIKEEKIEKLVIKRKDGMPMIYEERVLQQLCEKRPRIKDLVEMWTLKFEGGKELNVTKATLLLCGEYFAGLLRSRMKEAKQKTIDFTHRSEKFYEAFCDLLNEVQTGQKEMDEETYEVICNELLYTKWNPPILEGAFGPAEWEKLGVKIDEVPPVPEVILKRDNPENYLVVLIPGNEGFSELIKRSGIKIDYIWDKLEAEYGNQPAGRPYWVAIETDLLDGSLATRTLKEQFDMASEDGKHQAPTILEAVACNIASVKATGKGLWGMYNERFPFLTCCREDTLGGKKLLDQERLVVGCSPSGFFVDNRYGDDDDVGVARLFREF